MSKIFNERIFNKVMRQFGAVSIEAFAIMSIIGCIIVTIGVLIYKKRTGKIIGNGDIFCYMATVVYLSVVFQLTLFCRENGSRIGIELKPFTNLTGGDNDFHWLMCAYAILNVALFVPFGFFVSAYSGIQKMNIVKQLIIVVLLSFICSMIIEIMQLVTGRGYYQVEDLICNTGGGLAGALIFMSLKAISDMIRK